MLSANHEKIYDGKSRTTKSSKHQNTAWKGNLQILKEYWKLSPSNEWRWIKKSISEEPENYSGQNSIAVTLKKG